MSVCTMVYLNKPTNEKKLLTFLQQEIRNYKGCEKTVLQHRHENGRLHVFTEDQGGGSCWFNLSKDGRELLVSTYMRRGPLGITLQHMGTIDVLWGIGDGGRIVHESTIPSYSELYLKRKIWKDVGYENFDDLKPTITYSRFNKSSNRWERCSAPSDLKKFDNKWPYNYRTIHEARKNMRAGSKPIKKLDQYGKKMFERWIVARDRDFKEARKAGLYKGMSGFGKKITIPFYASQTSELVSLIGEKIESILKEWGNEYPNEIDAVRKKGFMAASTTCYMGRIEELLYLLESLLPVHLEDKRKVKIGSGFTIGDGMLFEQLQQVRDLLHFPPKTNQFYEDYKKYDTERLERSPQCYFCKKKGANLYVGGIVIHEECAYKYKFKYCQYCGHVYPGGRKKQCREKPQCKKYKLKYYHEIYKKEGGGKTN